MTSTKPPKSCLGLAIATWLAGAIVFLTLWAYVTASYGWRIYLEVFSHFQVQYFILCLILTGILILLKYRTLILIGCLCCAFLSVQIWPWYLPPNHLTASDREADFRILIANVNTQNTSYNQVLDLVRAEAPDIAVFMEVNRTWKDQLDTLSNILPYSSGQTNPYNLGLLVYSNQVLNKTKIEVFGTGNNPSVITEIMIGTEPILILATHPLPPLKPQFFHSRNQQLDLVSQYLESVSHDSQREIATSNEADRMLLVGDLNITMWSPYYKRLARKTNLQNARDGFGILPTWPMPVTYKPIPGWLTTLFLIPIDHCLFSQGLAITNVHLGAQIGSDHRPLIVDVEVVLSDRT